MLCTAQDDDSVNAEMYIKKAAALISTCKDEGLELQYKVRQRRVYKWGRCILSQFARRSLF